MRRSIETAKTWSAMFIATSAFVVACSSSSSAPAGGGDSGTPGGDTGGGSGLAACVTNPGVKMCSAPMTPAACGQEGGTVATNCPSDGVVGCCQYNGNGGFVCYYDAGTASANQSICTSKGNTWTTTVPAPTW